MIAGTIVLAVAAAFALVLAYAALHVIGLLYRAQWISDQSIQLDAVRVVFAVMQAPSQVPLSGLAILLVCECAARLGFRLLGQHGKPKEEEPVRLLWLRVFSLGRRSERLFRALSSSWRYIGSVQMITGPDLANTTVEPDEFLDFLGGRLQRRFIRGADAIKRRLFESQSRRDHDGRFRVASFFCYADTWQVALALLARESHLVLMDLRGFTPKNEGCVYELNELLDAVPLNRILLIVDDTTDQPFLINTLEQAWTRISAASSNRKDPSPRVDLWRLKDAGSQSIQGLLTVLAGRSSGEQLRHPALVVGGTCRRLP